MQKTKDKRKSGDHEPQATDSQDRAGSPKYVPLWNNIITMLGLFLVGMSIALMLTFWLFTLVSPAPNPYIDIFGYLVLPGIATIGIAIIPCGIFVKSWRLHRKDPQQRLAFRFPRVDLNDPAQRRAAKIVLSGMFILLPVVGVSGYHGYHYTDSADFCSKACHAAMHPQATAYGNSAHARVSCAECHIGSGASWFVKAKLSGTRQVLAMWRDTYSRPIAPAIKHLRPARETCEQCHWPRKFYGAQLREIVRYKADEENTRHEIDMLLNIGGGDKTTGREEGIHKHMALAGQIEYIATDDRLQVIPWVRYVDDLGNDWIYRSDGRPSSDDPPEGEVRQLDCMDCHNRPAHKFRSPQDSVDLYLESGMIDTTLPYIKREAVAALIVPYPDAKTAAVQIKNHLLTFYRENYPEILEKDTASVNNAVDNVRDIYSRSFFPDMKVDWKTYPDNIGHHISPGCFRCHEGRHVNQKGKTISHDCRVCHTFLNPIKKNGHALIEEGEFIHPFELQGSHSQLRCNICHTGGLSPATTCEGCHTDQQAFRLGTLETFAAFDTPPDPMADVIDCEGCHDLSEPTTIDSIDTLCMECHEDEEDRFEGMLGSWKKEVDQLLKSASESDTESAQPLLETLRKAGPMHNLEATRSILNAIIKNNLDVKIESQPGSEDAAD